MLFFCCSLEHAFSSAKLGDGRCRVGDLVAHLSLPVQVYCRAASMRVRRETLQLKFWGRSVGNPLGCGPIASTAAHTQWGGNGKDGLEWDRLRRFWCGQSMPGRQIALQVAGSFWTSSWDCHLDCSSCTGSSAVLSCLSNMGCSAIASFPSHRAAGPCNLANQSFVFQQY